MKNSSQKIGVKHKKLPNNSFMYWWNELVRGGNYVMYKVESNGHGAIKTKAKLQEKFIKSLRERLDFKRSKRTQLEANLNVIKRESRVAFEDLKYYIKSLKEPTDEPDGPRTPEVRARSRDSVFWKKLRRMLREENRQSFNDFQPHDSETDNE